ncbi:MAG: substrate-binding domain-containing protein [Tepidisphaeraceae bacterium]
MSTARTPKLKKYEEIVALLRTAIEQGTYAEGDRLPSEFDLVKQTGASRPTVARALRELQTVGLIRRRVGSGSYVSKQASAVQHKLLGLLIPRLGETEIFEAISGQITRDAERSHYGLLWGDIAQSSNPKLIADRTCEPYLRQRVAGVFFAPLELSAGKDEVNERIVTIFQEAKIPVVLLDRDLKPFPNRSRFDLVGIDNFAVGYMLAEHLVQRGAKRTMFVAQPFSAETVQGRIAGAYAALSAAKQVPAADWLQQLDVNNPVAVRAMIEAGKPDAIICANDKTAAELMQSLGKFGVQVPNHIRVVGVDDVRYAKLLSPALTTVHQPCNAIGETAMQLMIDRIARPTAPPRQVNLPISLIVRDSSR